MTRMVYLASPIDQSSGCSSSAWWLEDRAQIRLAIKAHGMGLYDPSRAFLLGGEVGPEVASINNAALDVCDALLAIVPKGVPSVGVPMEIERARSQGKCVVVVTDLAESWSLAQDGISVFTGDQIPAAVRHLAQEPTRSTTTVQPLPYTGEPILHRAYDGDAGFDLTVTRDTWIDPGEFVDVECGVRVELPDHVWMLVVGRSSTLRKRGLLVALGVIDSGYRGLLFSGVQNLGTEPVFVKAGERLAQAILFPNVSRGFAPVRVAELATSDRGELGFGSTGV